jgi:hypothetical protein
MSSISLSWLSILMASVSLALMPAIAKEPYIDNDASRSVIEAESVVPIDNMSGAQLVSFFEGADEAESTAFLASLTEGARETLIEMLMQAEPSAELLAQVIIDIITIDPDVQSCDLLDIVRANASQELVEEVVENLFPLIEWNYRDLSNDVLTGLLLAVLCCDTALTDRIILFANTLDTAEQDRFAAALLRIIDRAPACVASAVLTSLALEGGAVAELVFELRQQELAATVTSAELPSIEAGATSGTTRASTSGPDAVFNNSSRASTGGIGLSSGGATPGRPPRDVSP